MDHCSYNTNHWPCTYCEAPNPKHIDAKCRNEEELYCPLCGEKVSIEVSEDKEEAFSFLIRCINAQCLYPFALEGSKEKVIAKWKKYTR